MEDRNTPAEVTSGLMKLLHYRCEIQRLDGSSQRVSATVTQTTDVIQQLLTWRRLFMHGKGIPSTGPHYVFSHEDREQLLGALKTTFHEMPAQIELQRGDVQEAERRNK